MIYNIKDLSKDKKDVAFHVFNYLLGSGGISAKLYQKLRCENSLCYSVKSLYLKYDELLIISVSLDKSNVNTAQRLIKKCIKEMLNGKFSDTELNDAKRNLIVSLKMSLDNNLAILNNYVFHTFDDLPLLEERINLISKVTKEDLIMCGKHLYLNTVYIQNPKNNSERKEGD